MRNKYERGVWTVTMLMMWMLCAAVIVGCGLLLISAVKVVVWAWGLYPGKVGIVCTLVVVSGLMAVRFTEMAKSKQETK